MKVLYQSRSSSTRASIRTLRDVNQESKELLPVVLLQEASVVEEATHQCQCKKRWIDLNQLRQGKWDSSQNWTKESWTGKPKRIMRSITCFQKVQSQSPKCDNQQLVSMDGPVGSHQWEHQPDLHQTKQKKVWKDRGKNPHRKKEMILIQTTKMEGSMSLVSFLKQKMCKDWMIYLKETIVMIFKNKMISREKKVASTRSLCFSSI